MAQTKEGAKKTIQAMIARYGSREAFSEHMREIGSQGGKASKTGGFASFTRGKDGLTGKERASVAGKKGGDRTAEHWRRIKNDHF